MPPIAFIVKKNQTFKSFPSVHFGLTSSLKLDSIVDWSIQPYLWTPWLNRSERNVFIFHGNKFTACTSLDCFKSLKPIAMQAKTEANYFLCKLPARKTYVFSYTTMQDVVLIREDKVRRAEFLGLRIRRKIDFEQEFLFANTHSLAWFCISFLFLVLLFDLPRWCNKG